MTRQWKIFDQLDFAGFAARGPNAAAKLFFSSLSYGAGDKTAHMNKKLRQSGLFQLYEEVVSAIEHDGYYSAPQQNDEEEKDKDKTEAEDTEPLTSHADRTRRAKADVASPTRGSPSKRGGGGDGTPGR